MITVYIGGGLANKMFQYAFSLNIKKQGFDVRYDTHTFQTELEHDQVRLDEIFQYIDLPESTEVFFAVGKNSRLWRLYKKLSPSYIMESAYQYNSKIFQTLKDGCLVESSWQDERYFTEVENEVRKAFTFPELQDKRNIEMAEQMKESNSVAIHIRKGDGYNTWNIFQGTCTKEYYAKSLAYIKAHVDNPKFFVFTDYPDVIKEYLDIETYVLINWNPTKGLQNYLDMQLMSCAQHNIIANSTYSWWGAWLNPNKNKIVIGPKHWFNPDCKYANVNHVVPRSWIKL